MKSESSGFAACTHADRGVTSLLQQGLGLSDEDLIHAARVLLGCDDITVRALFDDIQVLAYRSREWFSVANPYTCFTTTWQPHLRCYKDLDLNNVWTLTDYL